MARRTKRVVKRLCVDCGKVKEQVRDRMSEKYMRLMIRHIMHECNTEKSTGKHASVLRRCCPVCQKLLGRWQFPRELSLQQHLIEHLGSVSWEEMESAIVLRMLGGVSQ